MHYLLNLPPHVRRALLIGVDTLSILIAVWAAFALRLGEWWSWMVQDVVWLFPLAVLVLLPALALAGLYRPILRYADESLLHSIVLGSSIGMLALMAMWVFIAEGLVPRSFWLLAWIVLVELLGGSRLLLRRYLRYRFHHHLQRTPVIIYGAGEAGAQLVQALRYSSEFEPLGFVDDNPRLQGSMMLGLKVWPPTRLRRVIAQQQIKMILLALPSASQRRRQQVLESLAGLPVRIMALPTLAELTSGARRIDELRDLPVEDILGREAVQPDQALLRAKIHGKNVLVTGAGGSIGGELCRQILALRPQRLLLFEHSEYALYRIEQELRAMLHNLGAAHITLIPLLGSVIQGRRLQVLMQQFQVQTVYHAAAYKHVPMVECNPIEGVRNNVFGTWRALEAAFPGLSGIMVGRGLIADPALLRKAVGGPAASREELRGYHDELYHGYTEAFGMASCAVSRMKAHWFYLIHLFDGADALEKPLRKAREGWEYETVVNQIFACWPK